MDTCHNDIREAQKSCDKKKENRLKERYDKLKDKLQKAQLKKEERTEKYKKQNWIQHTIDPRDYLDLTPPLHGDFYAPAMESPLSWATDDWDQRDYTPKELLLQDCVILSITHDNTNYVPKICKQNTYEGKYFNLARFCHKQWPIDRIQCAKVNLDKWLEKKKQQEKSGQSNGGNTDPLNEKKSDSKGAQNIHIQNYGIMENVRAENVQTGDKTLIHTETEKKKKGIFRNLWLIITAVVGFLGTLIGIFNNLGWLESFKAFFSKLFTHK